MGGSSTFGYETADGKIHYCIYRDYYFHENVMRVFYEGKVYKISESDGEIFTAESIDDYFSEERYEYDDSVVRGVYKMDGTVMYKSWGTKGYHVYYLSM